MITRRAAMSLYPRRALFTALGIAAPTGASAAAFLAPRDNQLIPTGYMRDTYISGAVTAVTVREIFDGRRWVPLNSADGLAVMNYILGRIP